MESASKPGGDAPARRTSPGRFRTLRRAAAAMLLAALAAAGYHQFWHYHLKRFQALRPGVFYRSAQPSELGMRYLLKHCGIKTIVSVQLYDFRLYRGLCDLGHPDGARESEYLAQLGVRGVQWPMGDETYWPWLTPWQFEAFFKLLDEPSNWPVAVHCQGGRHRTGTLAALFRLEYDRWPVDRALAEMYGFKFGSPIPLQEHNLRTYRPRPRPRPEELDVLLRQFGPLVPGAPPADYDDLVRRLRAARGGRDTRAGIDAAVIADLEQRRCQAGKSDLQQAGTFVLSLAERLIDEPDEALAATAAVAAAACLERPDAPPHEVASAAALVADFGDVGQQRRLLELLADPAAARTSPERFDALVAGVTSRYTRNRVPFLKPLLEHEACHLAPGARQCRYCDTAVARLSTIINRNLLYVTPAAGVEGWNFARQHARDWYAAGPAEARLGRLEPPSGNNLIHPGDPLPREDLSKLTP